MKTTLRKTLGAATFAMFLLVADGAMSTPAKAQNPEMQQKLADVKASMAANKQLLTHFTWVEQDTISLKGDQKKQEHFQVRVGPDGKNQKTSLDPAPPQQDDSGRRGRLKERIVEKKTDELKDYADQMKALAQQYVPPDKDKLQQAYAAGNLMIGPEAGNPNQLQLMIHNYVKQGDSMTLVFDKTAKQLVSIQINTYMSDPKDAMNLTVNFAAMPGGPNHVSSMVINGVSKELTVAVANSNYQHL
jgi:hypothetical protein